MTLDTPSKVTIVVVIIVTILEVNMVDIMKSLKKFWQNCYSCTGFRDP